jgi:ParB-like chromosome segregation protein Spo0J
MTDKFEFNQEVLRGLTICARADGRFVHPAIVQKGTGQMIDGFHRTEVKRLLALEDIDVYLAVEEYETDDPLAAAISINKTRRPWDDVEERRTQVQFLRDAGHSQRAISEIVGVHKNTVARDLKAKEEEASTVVPATGPNGPVAASTPAPRKAKGRDSRSLWLRPVERATSKQGFPQMEGGLLRAF